MYPRPKETHDDLQALIDAQADFIIANQLASGAIPWHLSAITDPWDHVEAAIALDLCRRHGEAATAYLWSHDTQNPDGSWYSSYADDTPKELAKDSNFAAYIGTGIWFHHLATRDLAFLRQMWPTVEKATDFVLRLQQPTGEVWWALSPQGKAWPGAILTSCCCIWHSICNSLNVARTLGIDKPDWEAANSKLFAAITERPDLFDRMGENKRRYAMNWFYPVLTGVLKGKEASQLIDREWSDFVIPEWGCKVALDEDVTAVAETSELIVALCLIGEHQRAKLLFDWALRLRDGKPGFARGVKLPEQQECPSERATWTSAALIIAIAALAKAWGVFERSGVSMTSSEGSLGKPAQPEPGGNDFVGYEALVDFMEQRALQELDGDILEIGAFMGGGTAKLARYARKHGKKVFVVDVFDPKRDETKDAHGVRMCDVYEAFLRGRSLLQVYRQATRGFDNIVTMVEDSKRVGFPRGQRFVFGFIDGNHQPDYVTNDFYLVWRSLVPGGAVGFHDYNFDLPDVTAAINRLVAKHRDEIGEIREMGDRHILFLTKKRRARTR